MWQILVRRIPLLLWASAESLFECCGQPAGCPVEVGEDGCHNKGEIWIQLNFVPPSRLEACSICVGWRTMDRIW